MAPFGPNALKELLNDLGGSVCDKFFNLMKRFPELVYQLIAYERNEDGSISDAMKDDICALACAGGDGSTGGTFAAPTGVSATDGTLGDRVRVTWNLKLGATSYQIFRRVSNDSSGAVEIGQSTAAEFDDTTAAIDTIYYYWVKAVTGTQTSAFSQPDSGYISTELSGVSDLAASQGWSVTSANGVVALQWTPVTGATAYDIYRGATSIFGAATLIDSDRVPFNNTESTSFGPTPTFVDNDGDLVYYDAPPATNSKFFYWVKAKRATPTPAVSVESNSAEGWVFGWGDGATGVSSTTLTVADQVVVVPGGVTRAWVVLFANGASGAGGGTTFGGGGGGGGGVAWGELAVAATGELKLLLTPSTVSARAAAGANGANGSLTELQYKAPAGAFVTKLTSTAATGGMYNAAGAGAGGAASVASAAGMTSSIVKDGFPGKPGNGNKGGRGGHIWGRFRTPGAHYNNFTPLGHSGDSGNGAGGSYASPSSVALATGGINGPSMASVIVIFRA